MSDSTVTKVVVIIYEGIFPNQLLEALLSNPSVKVTRIIRGGNIVGNKPFWSSIRYLARKASPLFLCAKAVEFFLYYAYTLIPETKRSFKSLDELSARSGVTVEVALDINVFFEGEYFDEILFSISYWQIVNRKTLSLFKTALNIHPAPLPEGKGLFPSFWLLLHSSESNRCYQTLHRMTPDVDGGEIVAQRSVALPVRRRSSLDYMIRATKAGCEMLATENFGQITAPGFEAANYTSHLDSYYTFPDSKTVLRFWAMGNRLMRFADIPRLLFRTSCAEDGRR